MKKEELIRRTMQIVREVFQKDDGTVISYGKDGMEWQFNHLRGHGMCCGRVRKALRNCMGENGEVEQGNYHVQVITEQVCIVSGMVRIVQREDACIWQETPYEIMVCMCNGAAECVHVHGAKTAKLLCSVRGLDEAVYFLDEAEVLYIEAAHNNVVWHCREYRVESRDSLKRLEQCLPDRFMRIQRGYIINVKHVHVIRRNELQMDNGDILPVPYRIYQDIREALLEKSELHSSLQSLHSSQKLEATGK